MSTILSILNPLVSVAWLWKHFDAPNLVVLDASMKKATIKSGESDPITGTQIKNARFLDIKNIFSEASAEFPNTMLSSDKFAKAARQLGINNNSAIVVYDELGIYSSPRVWWMFKAMGHDNIAVLDGGLPEWQKKSLPVEKIKEFSGIEGDFQATCDSHFLNDYRDVLKSVTENKKVILDARSSDRFKGMTDEPRPGLRSGHIPGSKNLPYSKLLDGHVMKSKKELSKIYSELVAMDESLIFSCGSGITACILALGAELIGIKDKSVYDGSWTEWGSMTELPIEK